MEKLSKALPIATCFHIGGKCYIPEDSNLNIFSFSETAQSYKKNVKVKVKFSPLRALEALRVVRG
jgi:hypothetical protein